MSRKRHGAGRDPRDPDAPLLVRSYAVTHPRGSVIPARSFEWDQLVYASQGVMSVYTAEGAWTVPPHRALWVPAGVVHHVEMAGKVAVRTLFFTPGFARRMPLQCRAVNVTLLVRELVLEISRRGLLRRTRPEEGRLARLLLEQLRLLPAVPLQLPTPLDPRARRLAERSWRDMGGAVWLAEAVKRSGASRRTMERIFKRETQMSLGSWLRRRRIVLALRLLAAGESVTAVALEVGYASPSAFIAAFRRELGTTPSRYFSTG